MAERAAADAPSEDSRRERLATIPVERVSRSGLKRLLALQAEEWLGRLDWDFTDIAALIADLILDGRRDAALDHFSVSRFD